MHYSGHTVSVPYYSAHCDYQVQLLGLGLLVAQKTGYESTDDVWIGVLSPNSVFPGLSTAHFTYS